MDIERFRASVASGQMPEGLSLSLQSLWVEARGEWDRAHDLLQDDTGEAGAWVHAYLHRKEGDLGNARYWYSRAGRPPSSAPHDEEWGEIVAALLEERAG